MQRWGVMTRRENDGTIHSREVVVVPNIENAIGKDKRGASSKGERTLDLVEELFNVVDDLGSLFGCVVVMRRESQLSLAQRHLHLI